MDGRILIIASYNGSDRHRSDYSAKDFLNSQFEQLSKLRHTLDRIVVVENRSNTDEEYETALKQFEHVLPRANSQGSYGGWRDGYLANPDYEWYFFIEDDYVFLTDDFDQKWIDLWKPGTSYIATKVGSDWGHPFHASISNGLTRGDILAKVNWDSLTASFQYDAALQLQWSALFETTGLRDIRYHYAAPYFVRYGVPVTEYGNGHLPLLIGPIQLIDEQRNYRPPLPPPPGTIREIDPMRHRQRLLDDPEYRILVGEGE